MSPSDKQFAQAALLAQAAVAGGYYGLVPLIARSQFWQNVKSDGQPSGDSTSEGMLTAAAMQGTTVGAFLAAFALNGDAESRRIALIVGSASQLAWFLGNSMKFLGSAYQKKGPGKGAFVALALAAFGFFCAAKKRG